MKLVKVTGAVDGMDIWINPNLVHAIKLGRAVPQGAPAQQMIPGVGLGAVIGEVHTYILMQLGSQLDAIPVKEEPLEVIALIEDATG